MKRWLKIFAGLAVSGLFIALSLRGKELGSVWRELVHANYLYLAPYFAILLAIHLVRTVRWGMLIAPLYKPPFRRLNAVSAVGFMLLIILPFRIGEVARPYLIRQPGKLSGTAAFASIVVERVLDGLIVAAMLVLLLLRVPGDTKEIAVVRAGGWGMFAFFGALLVFLLLAYWQQALALRLTHATFGRVSKTLGDKLAGMLETFIGGLRALPNWRSLAAIVFMTVLYWGLNGWGMQILGWGFDIHLGLIEAYTVLGVLVIGVMIPAGPGMAGTFQYFCQLGLALFLGSTAANGAKGTAYANVLWVAQFGQQVLLGLLFLLFFSGDLTEDHHHVTLGELVDAGEHLKDDDSGEPKPPGAARSSAAV